MRNSEGFQWFWFNGQRGKLRIHFRSEYEGKLLLSHVSGVGVSVTSHRLWHSCGMEVSVHLVKKYTEFGNPVRITAIVCPFWLPFILCFLFLIYPALAYMRGPLGRHGRRKRGLCLNCGYDLTGNVSGICPECGEKI